MGRLLYSLQLAAKASEIQKSSEAAEAVLKDQSLITPEASRQELPVPGGSSVEDVVALRPSHGAPNGLSDTQRVPLQSLSRLIGGDEERRQRDEQASWMPRTSRTSLSQNPDHGPIPGFSGADLMRIEPTEFRSAAAAVNERRRLVQEDGNRLRSEIQALNVREGEEAVRRRNMMIGHERALNALAECLQTRAFVLEVVARAVETRRAMERNPGIAS
ncbi:hypothetical protein F5890DRAFT_1474496 [Lentinula detonsa]|uniref:Uncharacterized protein n=1 Tax=Lentinula detonsa TaxID=2804962 RepID=A0AA38UUA2_9AGAR|nr:hypothetical protein F5890DRAFT_1474496 [Lentinula detonsa]